MRSSLLTAIQFPQQRASIENGMGDRVDEIAKTTALLPAPPKLITAAITGGTSEVATAAQTALVKNATASPLSRFGKHFESHLFVHSTWLMYS
jgi:hypothetical protein